MSYIVVIGENRKRTPVIKVQVDIWRLKQAKETEPERIWTQLCIDTISTEGSE